MGDRLKRGPHEVRPRRPARQPGYQPARVGIPVRRAEPRRARARSGRPPSSRPSGRAARSRPRSRSGRGRRAATARRRRRRGRRLRPRTGAAPRSHSGGRLQQPLRHGAARPADVREHERPGAVRGFYLAWCEAPLAEQGRLLVAGDAREWGHGAEQLGLGDDAGRRDDRGRIDRSTPNSSSSSSSHCQRLDVEQQRARRVRDVGEVGVTSCQLQASQESTVPKASCPSAASCGRRRIHSSFVAEK